MPACTCTAALPNSAPPPADAALPISVHAVTFTSAPLYTNPPAPAAALPTAVTDVNTDTPPSSHATAPPWSPAALARKLALLTTSRGGCPTNAALRVDSTPLALSAIISAPPSAPARLPENTAFVATTVPRLYTAPPDAAAELFASVTLTSVSVEPPPAHTMPPPPDVSVAQTPLAQEPLRSTRLDSVSWLLTLR